jgi:2'-5' RNA ligase
MKKRRIFIAINLSDRIKKRIVEVTQKWAGLPVRWTKKDNLHITLVFIGYVDNEEMLEICQTVQRIGQKSQSFEIKLKQVCFGPPNKEARMIWLQGEINQNLSELKNNLEEALFENTGYRKENRSFKPHITLARIYQREWKNLKDKPEIGEEISLSFPVDSIEIMESHLSNKGPDYVVLESIPLAYY